MKILYIILLFILSTSVSTLSKDIKNQFKLIDPKHEIIQMMGQSFLRKFQETKLSDVSLTGELVEILMAKRKIVETTVKEIDTRNGFFGSMFERPTEKEIEETEHIFILTMLLSIRFSTTLLSNKLPFLETITSEIICNNITNNDIITQEIIENKCDQPTYEIMNRKIRNSNQIDVSSKDIVYNYMIQLNKNAKNDFTILNGEYQNIFNLNDKSNDEIQFIRFLYTPNNKKILYNKDSCFIAIFHQDNNKIKKDKIVYIDTSCYNINQIKQIQQNNNNILTSQEYNNNNNSRSSTSKAFFIFLSICFCSIGMFLIYKYSKNAMPVYQMLSFTQNPDFISNPKDLNGNKDNLYGSKNDKDSTTHAVA